MTTVIIMGGCMIAMIVFGVWIYVREACSESPVDYAERTRREIKRENDRNLSDPHLYTRTAGVGVVPEYRRRA
jgi:hypothetical protein